MKLAFVAFAMTALACSGAHAQPQEPSQIGYATNPFLPDLTPGYVTIDGDIQVRFDQYLRLISGHGDATFGAVTYWTNNTVPFEFDNDFVVHPPNTVATGVNSINQTRAITAMTMIEERTGVDFRPANAGDVHRIRFQNSLFNNSPIGQQGGTQIINIVSWNNSIIICHEIYHSLGFWHEHNRADREPFITVHYGNICGPGNSPQCTPGLFPGCCQCINPQGNCISCFYNFDPYEQTSHWGPYDFGSFMHYDQYQGSCNSGPTITVDEPYATLGFFIGNTSQFSRLDTLSCRGIYPRLGDRWLRPDGVAGNPGTFFQPYATMPVAYAETPTNGTLFIDPGYYAGSLGTYSRPMTIECTYGKTHGTPTPAVFGN